MTQEIIKLKEQYEALQSSFKHLNHHLSPSSNASKDTSKKKRDDALRPVQENRARVQAFRPQDSSGTAANPRQRSALPSQQSRGRHSFRNTEIIRCVYIYTANGI
jgi:hypothetical protein